MTQKTSRSGIAFPDIQTVYSQSQAIRREAEIARAAYLHNLVSTAARKVAGAVRHVTELFAYAQRMNQNARL